MGPPLPRASVRMTAPISDLVACGVARLTHLSPPAMESLKERSHLCLLPPEALSVLYLRVPVRVVIGAEELVAIGLSGSFCACVLCPVMPEDIWSAFVIARR